MNRRTRAPGSSTRWSTRSSTGSSTHSPIGTSIGAAVLAVLALAGCSSSGDAGSSGSPATGATPAAGAPASPTPSPSASVQTAASPTAGLENASADEILGAARVALLRASSVHAKGNLVSEGTPYGIDMRMVRGTGAAGKIAVQGKGLTLVRIGDTAYVQPDAAFLRAATNSASSVRLLSGTYFKVTARKSALFAPFVALTDAEQAFGSALAPVGAVSKGAVTRVNNQRVMDLLVDGGKSGHVFVALSGAPYPVRIVYAGSTRQSVDLDGFNARVKLAAPPASKVKTVPGF